MSTALVQTLRRSTFLLGWLYFVSQVCIAISFEVADDLARGHFAQHGTLEGLENARDVIAFETAHHFFVEPAWQTFFLHTRHIFSLTISWLDIAHVMTLIYIGGHVGVTLGVAFWLFIARRRWFGMLRNVIILVNLFALMIYENFPVAPPRLTTGIIWNGRPFRFQDTVFGVMDQSGHIVGSQGGFNEYSAMPSVHMAWALVAGLSLVFLARAPWARIFGAIYPCLMLISVVVTGNHYFMDVLGGAGVVIAALLVAGAWERYGRSIPWPWRRERLVVENGP